VPDFTVPMAGKVANQGAMRASQSASMAARVQP